MDWSARAAIIVSWRSPTELSRNSRVHSRAAAVRVTRRSSSSGARPTPRSTCRQKATSWIGSSAAFARCSVVRTPSPAGSSYPDDEKLRNVAGDLSARLIGSALVDPDALEAALHVTDSD